ncbi:MAG: class I tRNA ligase family protein [bacterium]
MEEKTKNYILGMFPYPSGEGLHVGHVRIYTAVDVMARYFRMKGEKVMNPMGWDAFGLPAENAAIKFKKNPKEMVPKNYHNFRRQMEDLDLNFDWEHEFATTDPTYYGFTQWIFLELYKKGLVYREEVPINWCPKCKTGLANEEVMADGTHERCGEMTGKKNLPQWVMRITKYADRLLEDLEREQLDWPRGILEMQKHWIGKKEGVGVKFKLKGVELKDQELKVFTTRLDTIYGVTFVVVAPEKVSEWEQGGWEASKDVKEYVKEALQKTEQARLEEKKGKTGVKTEIVAVNPVNNEEVPVYVADYVLSGVGTGAVMGVPGYDERDLEFAKRQGINTEKKKLVESEKVYLELEKAGVVEKMTNYHLRDWVFSRQRYWGEPVPLVYCKKCGDENGVVPLPEKALPLTLPDLASYEPTETGESPLSRVEEWVKTTCPKCGGEARRETDTMPNWAGSCWYHLAFAFWGKDTEKEMKSYIQMSEKPYTEYWQEVAKEKIKEWLPVDWYLGGAEHAVLHLLYARFWNKVLQDLGHLDFAEPYLRLRSVGMVLSEDGRKMSKSWGNVINPDEMVKKFGSDAVRLYEMFMGPWEQAIAWDTRALVGMTRFIKRVEETVKQKTKEANKNSSPELRRQLGELVQQVEKGVEEQKFNTCIAGCMELVNAWRKEGASLQVGEVKQFASVLSLFAPKVAQRVWEMVKGEGKVEKQWWPKIEVGEREDDLLVTIAVQVNGKLRGTVEVQNSKSKDQAYVEGIVRKDEQIKKWVTGEVKKTFFIPGKLVSLVV